MIEKITEIIEQKHKAHQVQGPAGIQGPPGIQGSPVQQVLMAPTVSMEPMELMAQNIDPCVACLLDALVKLDSGAVLVNVTANLERGLLGPSGDVNITLPLVIDVDVATLLQAQLGETLGIGENATIFEICAAIDAEGLDITAVINALELDLDPIVTFQISQIVNQIAIAINEITGIPITPELIDEILASIDIDDIVAQITANVQVSLEILETCIGQVPPPPPTTATLNVTKNTQCDVEQFGQEICNFNPQITVTDDNPTPSSFPASATPQVVTLGAGQYNVSEAGFVPGLAQCAGFEGGQQIIGNIYACADFSEDCSGDISAGESLSCEIENTVIDTSPATASLTVNKEIYGCEDNETDPITAMDCRLLLNNDPDWISCNESDISDTSVCEALPENIFDIRVLDDQNDPIAEDIEGSELGTTIQNIEPGTYTVNEIKNPTSNINQLGENPDIARICMNVNDFTDGGELINLNADLDYNICLEYEDQPGNAQGDDCSTITLAAGEQRTCTVKNYIIVA